MEISLYHDFSELMKLFSQHAERVFFFWGGIPHTQAFNFFLPPRSWFLIRPSKVATARKRLLVDINDVAWQDVLHPVSGNCASVAV